MFCATDILSDLWHTLWDIMARKTGQTAADPVEAVPQ